MFLINCFSIAAKLELVFYRRSPCGVFVRVQNRAEVPVPCGYRDVRVYDRCQPDCPPVVFAADKLFPASRNGVVFVELLAVFERRKKPVGYAEDRIAFNREVVSARVARVAEVRISGCP